jgi:hypothetical protein
MADARLWCLHHIGPDEVHPAPDFATAWRWATWANAHFADAADISRFTVAPWPWGAAKHAEWLPRAVAEWTLPAAPPPAGEPTNFHEFETAFPLLALACKAADYDGDPNRDDLWEICISTALCPRFAEAERELEQLSARALLSVILADPGEELDCAPIACRVLTGIFA